MSSGNNYTIKMINESSNTKEKKYEMTNVWKSLLLLKEE